MTVAEFIEAARAYNSLGWAVQEQLESILDGSPVEEQNPNAVRYIVTFLQDVDLDDAEFIADEIAEAANVDGNLGW